MVFRRRLIVGVIVRKVGAGQNQRVGPRRQFRQRHAESAAGLVALVSHNHRHKLELSQHPLQEGQLDFDGMLRAFGKPDQRAGLGEFGGEGLVHGNLAERGGVGRAIVHRRETESFVMRRRNHHYAVEFLPFQQRVRVSGHRTRIHIARVRRHQRHHIVDGWRRSFRQVAVDHTREFLGVGRIERTRHRRWPDFGRLSAAA